jgi:hypothetical protein
LGSAVNGCGQIKVTAPSFCDSDGENRGIWFGELALGWPDPWFQASLKWMVIAGMSFYEFLLSVECRHIVFPEYKKFLIEIRLDRCRVIRAWTRQWKEVHHVLRKMG